MNEKKNRFSVLFKWRCIDCKTLFYLMQSITWAGLWVSVSLWCTKQKCPQRKTTRHTNFAQEIRKRVSKNRAKKTTTIPSNQILWMRSLCIVPNPNIDDVTFTSKSGQREKHKKHIHCRRLFVDNLYLLVGRLTILIFALFYFIFHFIRCLFLLFLRSLLIIHLIEIHLFTFTYTATANNVAPKHIAMLFILFYSTLALLSRALVHSLKFHLETASHSFGKTV